MMNKVYEHKRLSLQIKTRYRDGIMLTPAIWIGKGYAIGISFEWIFFFIAIGIIVKKEKG